MGLRNAEGHVSRLPIPSGSGVCNFGEREDGTQELHLK